MSPLRTELHALLARFDDEGWAALANRGLLRRAHKDLERLTAAVTQETDTALVVTVGEQRVRFDARGPAQAQCDCPAHGVCQHVLAAAIGLQRLGDAGTAPAPTTALAAPPTEAPPPPDDPLAPLRDSLLQLSAAELQKHAGKAGYRWAWQFVHDLDERSPLHVGGDKHLVLQLQRPRLCLRYMGGGLAGLIADHDVAPIAPLEKYRVAVVLAFQQAHGRPLTPPEPTAAARAPALAPGADPDAPAPPGSDALADSRQRLRSAAGQLFTEAITLGLAHLSSGMHERFTTLAVWAQGAEYHRLALLLRRMADHIELLLQRAGGADEHRLLDEISLANALVSALDAAAARGLAPVPLVGRARTRYDDSGPLNVLGLGAYPWRSASGYVGLTLLFWSPREGFMSCTDARPATLPGFDPIARYRAAGPWNGLGTPQRATGQRLALVGAQLNEAMRLSARDSTAATLLPADPQAWAAERLQPWSRWAELSQARHAGHSLLMRPAPLQDWAFLQPSRLGPCQFDATRQTLQWPLWDGDGQVMVAELRFEPAHEHAIGRIEALPTGPNTQGLIVVARVRHGETGLVAEPLSLIRPGATEPVDALHFDDAPTPSGDGLLARWRRAWGTPPPRPANPAAGSAPAPSAGAGATPEGLTAPLPAAFAALRHHLQRSAERGLHADLLPRWHADLAPLLQATQHAGLTAFTALRPTDSGPAQLLRLNYLCLEYAAGVG